jgi:ATP-dependent Lon protease
VRNPIILLDELDKASGQSGLLADVMATMLEILDPEQNTSFRDHYLDYPIDLSQVMFIVSANKLGTFSAALMDRLEIIKMPSYTDEEKQVISRDYLLPRVRAATGLLEDQLEFSPDVWPVLLRPLGYDSGIRSLQRIIESMARQAALEIVTGKATKIYVTPENFRQYLPKYTVA